MSQKVVMKKKQNILSTDRENLSYDVHRLRNEIPNFVSWTEKKSLMGRSFKINRLFLQSITEKQN